MPKAERIFAPINFKDRFPALDGIRALAIASVFFHHFGGGGTHGGRLLQMLNQIRERGWLGVDIFFVLSGFLITGILYDTREDSRYFYRFFVRRAVRIFPVFYLVVLLVLLLTPILHYQLRWGYLWFLVYLGNFIGNYDFSYYAILSASHPNFPIGISHFWSLCVEEQFYLLWPFVVWWIGDRLKLVRVGIAIVALAMIFRIVMLLMTNPFLSERWIVRTLPFRMDSLIIGALLALLLRGPNADRWQRLCRPTFLVAAPVAVVMLTYGTWNVLWFPVLIYPVLAIASAGLIGMALRSDSASFRLFYWKPFRTLGKYSYGFYVYHLLFGWSWIMLLTFFFNHVHSVALAGTLELTACFATTFLVSKLSYDLIEVKFLRLKRLAEYDSEIIEHKHAFTTQ